MISSLLMEAALRSVFLALAVWIGLRVFSVRNVLAQKVAWGLVLASALAMPVVLPMTEHWSVLPANVRVVIPADPENLLEELQARIKAETPEAKPSSTPATASEAGSGADASEGGDQAFSQEKFVAEPQASLHASADLDVPVSAGAGNRYPTPTVSQSNLSAPDTPPPPAAPVPVSRRLSLLQLAGLIYLAVAGVLNARLIYGLLATLRVWWSARPVLLGSSPLTDGLRLRVSDSVSSPVTIGSAVVLPSDYHEWDSEKLRIVLAHERSHVRQGDFYLQLLAGFYAAVVWFSPLGWWLKRTLSDLAEAISDRAGLEEAADRTAYAQVLLEFAASPRPTLIGVAMARSGSLSRRIERLLNDVSFRQAFAESRRALVAVVVIPLALFVATALVRVEAAGQQEPAAPSSPAAPSAGTPAPDLAPATPEEGVSNPEQVNGDTDQLPAPAVGPQSPERGVTPKAAENCSPDRVMTPPAAPHMPAVPSADLVPPAAHAPSVTILQGQPGIADLAISPRLSLRMPMVVVPRIPAISPNATLAIVGPSHGGFGLGYGYGVGQSGSGPVIVSDNGKRSGYHYRYSSNGDSYAIVKGDGSSQMSFNGEIHTSEIDKARKQAHGDFLWFRRDGKAYLVDDQATVGQIEAMYKPMEELGRQQEELGKKQEELGKQQEDLGKQQEAASVPTPDMSKEIAEIEEAMAKLKASQGKNMSQDDFGDLQEKLGELQSRIGEIQGQIGEKQGEFGSRMGELGEKMGELGAKQGKLGAREGKLAEQADQKVRSIIEESLKNGKAHPVQ